MSLAPVFLAAYVGGGVGSWGFTPRAVGEKRVHKKAVQMTNVHPEEKIGWRPETRDSGQNMTTGIKK